MREGIIKELKVRKVIDTRAEDTIEVEVVTARGAIGHSQHQKSLVNKGV